MQGNGPISKFKGIVRHSAIYIIRSRNNWNKVNPILVLYSSCCSVHVRVYALHKNQWWPAIHFQAYYMWRPRSISSHRRESLPYIRHLKLVRRRVPGLCIYLSGDQIILDQHNNNNIVPYPPHVCTCTPGHAIYQIVFYLMGG